LNGDINNSSTDGLESFVHAGANRAITITVWDGIRPVALALSGLYLLFAIGHLFLLPERIRILMVGFAGTTAMILFGLSILMRHLAFSQRLTYPICFFIIIIASFNSLLHLYLSKDILQTTNLMLVIFGAGYFILSRRWYFGSLLLIVLGWCIFIIMFPGKDGIVHFSIALFSVSLLATLFNLVRTRTLLKVEKLRLVNEFQRGQLEKNILVIEEAQQELERFFNLSIDMLCIAGFDGYFKKLSSAFTKILGYSKQELLSTPFMDFVHPDDQKVTKQVIKNITSGFDLHSFENRFMTKDGEYKWILWNAASFTKGDLMYAIGHDITQRKESQLALEEREKRMNAILNTAVDGIIVIDEQGIIQTFNKAASKIFGYTENEGIGQNVNIIMPDSIRKNHYKYLSSYTNQHDSKIIGELTQREGKRKNGEIFPLTLAVSAVELQGRKLFTGIIRDISEQVRIENELKETRQRLQNEIDLAAQIQSNLMEKTIPEFNNFEFSAVNIPARYLSGDFYDIVELNSNTHQLVLGDFAGKGIPAALLALSIRSLIRAESNIEKYPGVVLAFLNQRLFQDLDQAEVFATLFLAQVDLDISRVHYASAGHGEALIWRNAERNIVKLQATGLPVGIFFDETYNEQQIDMRPGDVLIIYSDGITESTNLSLEQFGFERLAEIIKSSAELSASSLSSRIINRVKQFSEGHEQDDDISLLVMRSLPRTIELEIPGTIAILDHILATIHEYTTIYSMDFADEVELACSEAITNIIKHAYQSLSGTIQIKIHLEPDGLVLDLFDQGESFDIELVSEPDPDNLLESGYGISIMNQIFDQIVYESDHVNGNHWHLVKKFIGE
jgi:PAS domain S-box-containing protein